jgi:hypothetical protein
MEDPTAPSSKCYLTLEGGGLISCLSCGFGKAFDFKGNMPVSRKVMVRCKCGNHVETLVEVRQYYRKRVKMLGEYTNMTSRRSDRMIVENISQKGFGFRVMGVQFFKEKEMVKVAFESDNDKKSVIVLKSQVRRFRGNFVGCRILEIPEGQKEIGFYLLP